MGRAQRARRKEGYEYQWVCSLLCMVGPSQHQSKTVCWCGHSGATQSVDHHYTEPNLKAEMSTFRMTGSVQYSTCVVNMLTCNNMLMAIAEHKQPLAIKRGWRRNSKCRTTHSPILVLSAPTSKALTKFSKNDRTRRKLMRPILQDPSTRITMSAVAGILQVNSSTAKNKRMMEHFL